MKSPQEEKIDFLINHGVSIFQPATVEIGPEVGPEAIAPGVVIHSGCRIRGKKTLIMAGARLGEEGPATIQDCQIGPEVELKGGSFREATFLKGAKIGSGAQVREGCLLEEFSGGAHAIGLKQTILFPFVTLGSLVNFCDCLMGGGTGRKNHSEVGSSYIHFNFTPQQDKATPSLIGDVPRGVMVDQPPIFLGGQGGIVGPARIGFGTMMAAGAIFSGDCPEGGKIFFGPKPQKSPADFKPDLYRSIRRKTLNNINFIANLLALRQWYLRVRSCFSGGEADNKLLQGAREKLELGISERIRRMEELAGKMDASRRAARALTEKDIAPRVLEREEELARNWPRCRDIFNRAEEREGDTGLREELLQYLKRAGSDYLSAIQSLPSAAKRAGSAWLDGIITEITAGVLAALPSFQKD